MERAVYETNVEGLKLLARGKVRDIYEVDDDHLLMVATDRLSSFDVVLPNGIPGRGKILNEVSNFWFELLSDVIENHIVSTNVDDFPEAAQAHREDLEGRSMLVRRTKPLLVECIARGYLTGSGYKDYLATGMVCGHLLPPGLPDAARLEDVLFTPSTKAEQGLHDENITFEKSAEIVGMETAEWLRETTLKIYNRARDYAEERGIIIADTKMEFGRLPDGKIILIDEVLTPDASRFWYKGDWAPGKTPPSYDKQIVRNYLLTLDWDKTPPGPTLPSEVTENAGARYREIAQRLMG